MPRADATDLSIAYARRHLARLLNRVAFGRERIVLCRYGRPVAGLVTVSDVRHLEEEDEEAESGARR
jgi:prevent-host-death family protein